MKCPSEKMSNKTVTFNLKTLSLELCMAWQFLYELRDIYVEQSLVFKKADL